MKPRTEFEGPDGIVISLDAIIQGGKEGVLNELRDDLHATEGRLIDLDDDRAELLERLEQIELTSARLDAKRDALVLAIEAAEKALS